MFTTFVSPVIAGQAGNDGNRICWYPQKLLSFADDNGQAEMNAEFIHVTTAEYISGYLLKLTFSNGDVRLFDFSQLYNKGIFVKLQNPEYFRNYTLDGWTVDWNNEIGFAPEYLH